MSSLRNVYLTIPAIQLIRRQRYSAETEWTRPYGVSETLHFKMRLNQRKWPLVRHTKIGPSRPTAFFILDHFSATDQMAGCEELFERERHQKPLPGGHACALACTELEGNA